MRDFETFRRAGKTCFDYLEKEKPMLLREIMVAIDKGALPHMLAEDAQQALINIDKGDSVLPFYVGSAATYYKEEVQD